MEDPATEARADRNSHQHKEISLCRWSVRRLAFITIALPFSALLICFITAYIFRYDEVHETHCRVFNVIPSISAITGISPQMYVWRFCVALHIGPRIIIAHLYKNYFSILANAAFDSGCWVKKILVSSCYWFNVVELTSLCGVTYISNRDNYPIHEKLFIIFMVCSLMYMCAMTWSYKVIHPSMTSIQNWSYVLKRGLLITSLISTCTLVLFFLKHRLYCHDLAFTWFAFSEYVIASCNMGFHLTVAMDFPDERLVINSNLNSSMAKKSAKAD